MDWFLQVESNLVVILASLLCALICALALISVALPPPASPRVDRGLKKKVLEALPRETLSDTLSAKFTECAICLAEFAGGEEVRVLPKCRHGFHMSCINRWLGAHSSCPSCRQMIAVAAKRQQSVCYSTLSAIANHYPYYRGLRL